MKACGRSIGLGGKGGGPPLRSLEIAEIDFASRFPPRQLDARGFEAKILELGIKTTKIESGACDLPPKCSKKRVMTNS